MLLQYLRPALLIPLLATSAAANVGQLARGQIRTVDIPASQPEPAPPSPEAPETPEPEPSGGLVLDLPTVDEARETDAATGTAVEPAGGATEVDGNAVATAMAAAEAVRLRAANAEQLAVARRQLDQIEADKRAERDRMARYREAQAAHAAAMADYNAQLEAARAARQRWEGDVAACQSGDRSRCAPPPVASN